MGVAVTKRGMRASLQHSAPGSPRAASLSRLPTHLLLVQQKLLLARFDNVRLGYGLEGKDLLELGAVDKGHLTKAALAKDTVGAWSGMSAAMATQPRPTDHGRLLRPHACVWRSLSERLRPTAARCATGCSDIGPVPASV